MTLDAFKRECERRKMRCHLPTGSDQYVTIACQVAPGVWAESKIDHNVLLMSANPTPDVVVAVIQDEILERTYRTGRIHRETMRDAAANKPDPG